METINFSGGAKDRFGQLKKLQPNKPLYAYEFYPGWSDSWTQKHHKTSVQTYTKDLEETISLGGSFGMYMFIGGTNFGWMAGGDGKVATTTSYDFDAPLSESGQSDVIKFY